MVVRKGTLHAQKHLGGSSYDSPNYPTDVIVRTTISNSYAGQASGESASLSIAVHAMHITERYQDHLRPGTDLLFQASFFLRIIAACISEKSV